MRGLTALLALSLAACSAPTVEITPTPTPTHEPGTALVTVLLDLSGARAPSGVAQRNAMQLWLDQQQLRGGPQRIRAKFVDLAGSDAQLLIELRRAAVDDRADAVVIGSPFAYDETFASALAVARLPILLTLPAPDPASRPGGGWAFALAPTYTDLARAAVTDATQRGVLLPVLLASDESPPAIAERLALAGELEQRGLEIDRLKAEGGYVTADVIDVKPTTPGLEGMLAKFRREHWHDEDEVRFIIEGRGIFHIHPREGAVLATWPGSRNLAAVSTAPTSPERAAFLQSFSARHGAASTPAATAYDALALIDAAAASVGGTPDRMRLRDRLEATTFAGITTRYAFTAARHAGFDTVDLVYLRWSVGARVGFALAPEPAPKEER